MNSIGEIFGRMLGPIPAADIRLGMNGLPAVNVNTGGTPQYRTYDFKTGTLTNCSDFALDIDGSFFLIPATTVSPGDIIMGSGGPCCVIEAGERLVKVFSYLRGTIEELVPEQHIFMGNSYCYGKIFSPFANMLKGSGGMNNAVRLMVLSSLFSKNGRSGRPGDMDPMMLMMLMGGENGILGDMFEGVFTPDGNEKEG